MSIKQKNDLPGLGESVQDLTSIFKVTVKNEIGGDGHGSPSDVAMVRPSRPAQAKASRPSRTTAPEHPTKKVDGFLVFLYLVLVAGLAGVAWVTYWLFSPTPNLPLP